MRNIFLLLFLLSYFLFGMVNINSASKDMLMSIKGIGSTKADAIIEYRTKNGAFKSIEDIMNIKGIGKGIFEKIKDNISVDKMENMEMKDKKK